MKPTLKAGRELDALIATKIFGANVVHVNQQYGWRIDYVSDRTECNTPILSDYGVEGHMLKAYSTDISAAWEVFEKLSRNPDVLMNPTIQLTMYGASIEFEMKSGKRYNITEREAPYAICLAAAIGLEERE